MGNLIERNGVGMAPCDGTNGKKLANAWRRDKSHYPCALDSSSNAACKGSVGSQMGGVR